MKSLVTRIHWFEQMSSDTSREKRELGESGEPDETQRETAVKRPRSENEIVEAFKKLQLPSLRSVLEIAREDKLLPSTIVGLSSNIRDQYNDLSPEQRSTLWRELSSACFPDITSLPSDLASTLAEDKAWIEHLRRTWRWIESLHVEVRSGSETEVRRPFQALSRTNDTGADHTCATVIDTEEMEDEFKAVYMEDEESIPVFIVKFADLEWNSSESLEESDLPWSFERSFEKQFRKSASPEQEFEENARFSDYPPGALEVDQTNGAKTTNPFPEWIGFNHRYTFSLDIEPSDPDGAGGGVDREIQLFCDVLFDWSAFDNEFMQALVAARATLPQASPMIVSQSLRCRVCTRERSESSALYVCARCRNASTPYCSRACQRVHWPAHRDACHRG